MKLRQIVFFCIVYCGLQADEYIITSLADSGSGTLREAMLIAVDDDVITFDASLIGTISLGSSLPMITAGNLSILGPNSLAVAIDGNSQYQIFNIAADQAKITNLSLNNGANASFGGAIFVATNLDATLNNVSINACSSSICQSPIYIDDGAFISFINPAFTSGIGPDISFVNASAKLQNNTILSPTIYIDGSGAIETEGPGSLSLLGFSTPISLLIYNQSGTCAFSGTTSSVVVAHGTVTGNFNAQYIANIGTIQPGNNGIGSITSLNDFIQSPDGNLQIKITAGGTNDLVDISGNFYPRGVLTILPQAGSYTAGTRYTFVTTTGGINSSFDSVICPIEGFPFVVVYHSNFIEIVITNNWSV